MIRLYLSTILISLFILPSFIFAEEGFIGENPGLDFYSRIDETSRTIASWLIKKRLSEYSTFAGFGRNCRPKLTWFDWERMSRTLLDQLYLGDLTSLSAIAGRKKVILSTESLQNLANCLVDTYTEIQKWALTQYNWLATMGNMWLYMDGDTSNSDYDIISDIEKINSLIFTEELKYEGTKNGWKTSLSNLLAGRIVDPLISDTSRAELNEINPGSQNPWSTTQTTGTNTSPVTNPVTPTDLWIWDLCTKETRITSIENMVDENFLEELGTTLQWKNSDLSDGGWTYSARDRVNESLSQNSENTSAAQASSTSKWDVFWNSRCDSIFCIKVKMVTGSSNLFGWSKTTSIESILDKHIGLMEKFPSIDMGSTEMTKNILEIPYTGLSLKLKSKVKWWGVFISTKSTPKEKLKKDETPDSKDEVFRQALRCGLYSAGFESTNMNMVNSVMWAGYISRMWETITNKDNTSQIIAPLNPDDIKWLAGCMSVAIKSGREAYYQSVGDDLSEIMTFTDSMMSEVIKTITAWEKIDTLKVVK